MQPLSTTAQLPLLTRDTATAVVSDPGPSNPLATSAGCEVSVVIPCLNEVATLTACITKAQRAMREAQIEGEVLIADNGSTDGSVELAESLGARVVPVAARGYGNALMGGIAAARGRYIIMGDADDSYDFLDVPKFVDQLRLGHELVMGNRFRGGIMPGAMPWKHKWIGNPGLTWLGRTLFRCPVGDVYCGLRGFAKSAYDKLELQCTGMEFAIEMLIKATLLNLSITEVPTILHPDGRGRPPHLRTFRDGWRTLRLMLLFSPRWMFFVPGIVTFLAGLMGVLWLLPGPRLVGSVNFDIHSMLVAGFVNLLGYQLITFALFTKIFAVTEGMHPPSQLLQRLKPFASLETGVVGGLLVTLAGCTFLGGAIWHWGDVGFGNLNPTISMRQVIPAVLLMMLGVQTIFASFFLSILTMRRKSLAKPM